MPDQPIADFVKRLASAVVDADVLSEKDVYDISELIVRGDGVFGEEIMEPLRVAVYEDPSEVEDTENGGLHREKHLFTRELCRCEYKRHIAKAAASIQDGSLAGDISAVEDTVRALSFLKSSYDAGDAVSPAFRLNPSETSKEDIAEVKKLANRSSGVKTGQVFDEWSVLLPGEIGIILSMPSVGKTTMLTAIGRGYCENSSKGKAVFHFSEEMGLPSMLVKYTSGWKHKGDLILKANPTGTSTIAFLDRQISQQLKEHEIDSPSAIIVDYVSLLKPSRSHNNKYESLAELIVDLRGLGGKWGCPVWTATQPQRQPGRESRQSIPAKGMEPRCLGMVDVADCWAFAQVADLIVSLNQTEEERSMDPPMVRVHNAKTRNPNGPYISRYTIATEVDYATCRFASIEGDGDKVSQSNPNLY